MSNRSYQLLGLGGFVLSGVLFLIAGLRAGDGLAVAGSLAWIVACGAWGAPFLRDPWRDEP